MQSTITEVKDIANILFLIIAATVAILTYIQAKRTVFTPIKTETFKMQMKVMEEIFSLLQDKNEDSLIRFFDEQEIFDLNAFSMLGNYAKSQFPGKMKVSDAAEEDIKRRTAGVVVKASHVERYFREVTPLKDSPENLETYKNSDWSQYSHGMIVFTHDYKTNTGKLRRISLSPLLPSAVKHALGDLLDLQHRNLLEVGTALTHLAPEVPRLCPDPESIFKLEPSFFWNQYNRRRKPLEPAVEATLGAIRNYLQVEQLLR